MGYPRNMDVMHPYVILSFHSNSGLTPILFTDCKVAYPHSCPGGPKPQQTAGRDDVSWAPLPPLKRGSRVPFIVSY